MAVEQLELEWDIEDRDKRLESGELTEPIEDPTEVIVRGDE
jgi:hypothetical protein